MVAEEVKWAAQVKHFKGGKYCKYARRKIILLPNVCHTNQGVIIIETVSKSNSHVVCRRCEKTGHVAPNCNNRNRCASDNGNNIDNQNEY